MNDARKNVGDNSVLLRWRRLVPHGLRNPFRADRIRGRLLSLLVGDFVQRHGRVQLLAVRDLRFQRRAETIGKACDNFFRNGRCRAFAQSILHVVFRGDCRLALHAGKNFRDNHRDDLELHNQTKSRQRLARSYCSVALSEKFLPEDDL